MFLEGKEGPSRSFFCFLEENSFSFKPSSKKQEKFQLAPPFTSKNIRDC